MPSESATTGSPSAAAPGLPLPLSGRTDLYAILGDPIAQAGSPVLFNSAFRRRGWPAVLVPMQVPATGLAAALKGLRQVANLRGLVLTTPHKAAALAHVDGLGPESLLVRSVNAIRCTTDGRWLGDNFDGRGLVEGLRRAGHRLQGRHILVVGTGGAGRAVAAALARREPARLRLCDRDAERAAAAARDLAAAVPGLAIDTGGPDPVGFDTVINCTPLGMAKVPGSAVDPTRLAPGTLVADLVIEPEMTTLLTAARARGCLVHPGWRTLEGQVDAVCDFFAGADHG
jgi:shikimate dehydrogenase